MRRQSNGCVLFQRSAIVLGGGVIGGGSHVLRSRQSVRGCECGLA